MQNHKLITALKSLSSRELREFLLYVQSPFFNQQPRCITLLENLSAFAPDYSDESLNEKTVFKALFPDEAFHPQKLRDEFARLFRLIKGFMAIQEFESRPWEKEVFLLAQFRTRQLDKAFQTQLQSMGKKLESSELRDAHYYKTRSEIAHEANGFYGQQQVRKMDYSIQDRADHLDVYYLIHKLRESCEMLNRKHVMNADYQLHILPELKDWLAGSLPQTMQVPAVEIYYRIYLTLSEPDAQEHYVQLVRLLDQHHRKFSHEEARGMYKYAQNYCIRQINQGNQRFLKELFDLYQTLLQNGLILTEGELSHADYKNITTVALRNGDFTWARNFLEAYRKKVADPFRENVYNYCLATLFLENEEYDRAVRLLHKVQFTDLQYQVSARYVLIKAYYEMEEWDSLEYMIKAFLNFLRRNKGISPANRTNHKNFLKILKRILRLRHREVSIATGEFDMGIDQIREELSHNQRVPHIQWLAKVLDRLTYSLS